jgi:hypothetical protein
VRYEDDEKQLRRQRQYTAGGVGSSRSRSSKSSRRSLVGPPSHICRRHTVHEYFSIAARECHWLGNLSPLEVHHFGGEVHGGRQNRIGRTSESTFVVRDGTQHSLPTFELCFCRMGGLVSSVCTCGQHVYFKA